MGGWERDIEGGVELLLPWNVCWRSSQEADDKGEEGTPDVLDFLETPPCSPRLPPRPSTRKKRLTWGQDAMRSKSREMERGYAEHLQIQFTKTFTSAVKHDEPQILQLASKKNTSRLLEEIA
ncbi:hypothetical protein E2C01_033291 [Portunus trituberculatus]|uniref:Uncharacterized protein n=1 Tax=Portunus trituberculatus TaxID=210409 RepID=A0A5B7F3T6_PORTR|nr:hypothetical protein [Portunus trituberculatus]